MNIRLTLEHWPRVDEPPDRECGSLLLELVAVVAILSAVAAIGGAWAANWIENRQITHTERGIVTLTEAVYNYRMTHANPGEWPGSLRDLQTYVPTFAADGGRNGVGQPYTLDPPSNRADPVAPIYIETDLLDTDRAEKVRREFPNTGSVQSTVVRIEVPVPGHEPARNALLARDGTRQMTGNLDLDRHSIEDVRDVQTTQVTVAGEPLSGVRVRFLNQLANLSCSANQAVLITNGSPGCVTLSTSTITPVEPRPQRPEPPTEQCPARPGHPSGLDSRANWNCQTRHVNGACIWDCNSSCGSGDDILWYTSGSYGRSRTPFLDMCSGYSGCYHGHYSTDQGRCYVGGQCRQTCRQVR